MRSEHAKLVDVRQRVEALEIIVKTMMEMDDDEWPLTLADLLATIKAQDEDKLAEFIAARRSRTGA